MHNETTTLRQEIFSLKHVDKGYHKGGEDDIHDVVLHAVIHVDLVDQRTCLKNRRRIDDPLHIQVRRRSAH